MRHWISVGRGSILSSNIPRSHWLGWTVTPEHIAGLQTGFRSCFLISCDSALPRLSIGCASSTWQERRRTWPLLGTSGRRYPHPEPTICASFLRCASVFAFLIACARLLPIGDSRRALRFADPSWASLFSILQRTLDQLFELFIEAFSNLIDLFGFESPEDARGKIVVDMRQIVFAHVHV